MTEEDSESAEGQSPLVAAAMSGVDTGALGCVSTAHCFMQTMLLVVEARWSCDAFEGGTPGWR